MARFYIETYGCQMNVSESDSLHELLLTRGHVPADGPEDTDVVILNTCSVRKTAEQRIKGRLGFYRGLYNTTGKKIHLILMGCVAQNTGMELKKAFPEIISLVWGTYNKDGILDFFDNMRHFENFLKLDEYHFIDAMPQERFPFKSFVPISHGCENFCTYCIVPHVRGPEIHRKADDIIENILKLEDRGILEITLLGQNVNSYFDNGTTFPELLDRIAVKTKIPRIGFLTSHPKDFSKDLADIVASHKNILKCVHLPAQSGSNKILQKMNRKYTIEQFLEKAELVKTIPDCSLTTDLIVGFPGETEEDFQETLTLIKTAGFQEAFMYHYNTRPGTPAAKMPDQVPEAEKRRRLSLLIDIQLNLVQGKLKSWVGKNANVLTEAVSKKKKSEIYGRSEAGIPVYTVGNPDETGKIIPVRITGVTGAGLSSERL